MKKTRNALLLSLVLTTLPFGAQAQMAVAPEPHNVVQLWASGTVEAQQDLLTLTLSTTRQGTDANNVQTQLREALEGAMAALKKTAQPGAMDVRSGAFNLQPRYGNDGKINGWIGSSDVVLEGNDFSRISTAAARAQTMAISSLSFGLSRTARAQLESQAQALAIDSFKLKAAQIARGFGLSDYALREVNVGAADQPGIPVPRMMAMGSRAMAADVAPMPMESGKSLVVVTVTGTVQLK